MYIGQAKLVTSPPDEPPVIGDGSYWTVGQPLTGEVLVTNITTGDVIDVIRPDEFQTKIVLPAPLPTRYCYIVHHSKPVKEGDMILVDGLGSSPNELWKVAKYTVGIVITWRLEFVKMVN